MTDAERRFCAAVLWGYIDTRVLVTGGDCNAGGMEVAAYELAQHCARQLERDYWGKPQRLSHEARRMVA